MGDDQERPGFKTYRGFAAPGIAADGSSAEVPPAEPDPAGEQGFEDYGARPMVEIEVIHQHGPAPRADPPFPTVEVWTQNRIYTTDPFMRCIAVTDRATRELVPTHPFLGARLVGGQHHESGRVELSYPFPRPGTEAVFEAAEGRPGVFARTSTVSRVVLRMHVVTVAPGTVVPTWNDISNSIPPPPPTPTGSR